MPYQVQRGDTIAKVVDLIKTNWKTLRRMNPHDVWGHHRTQRIALGTQVELKNPKTGASVKAVVTDRGPYVEGRDVDLSYGLARKLSLVDQGVGTLTMRVWVEGRRSDRKRRTFTGKIEINQRRRRK